VAGRIFAYRNYPSIHTELWWTAGVLQRNWICVWRIYAPRCIALLLYLLKTDEFFRCARWSTCALRSTHLVCLPGEWWYYCNNTGVSNDRLVCHSSDVLFHSQSCRMTNSWCNVCLRILNRPPRNISIFSIRSVSNNNNNINNNFIYNIRSYCRRETGLIVCSGFN